MKKRHGLARALEPIPRAELEALPTGALLARLKRLRWCEDSRERSDLTEEEIASVPHLILFKDQASWKTAYIDIKEALAAREHFERKS